MYKLIACIFFYQKRDLFASEGLYCPAKKSQISKYEGRDLINMKALIELQKMIYPDLLESMEMRFNVLYAISLFEPIGRRGIVEQTRYTERYIRNEVEILQTQGLIKVTTQGMYVTEDGQTIINELQDFIREFSGVASLEDKLKETFNLNHVLVVSGNSEQDDFVKDELGRATVSYLKELVDKDEIIAVTGGTTMASVASAMVPLNDYKCLFVPARGGVGSLVENQANTIAAKMGSKEKGEYALLHVPDPMSEALYQTMLKEASIADTLRNIKRANIVLHGVGNALKMAERRQTNEAIYQKLKLKKAVAEAFGYYFDEAGEVVHKVRTIGLQLNDLSVIDYVITVAGGKSKARAIAAFMKQGKSDVLITDEAVANELLNIK